MPVSSPIWLQWPGLQGWDRPKAGARDIIWSPIWVAGAQKYGPSSTFLRHMRDLYWK